VLILSKLSTEMEVSPSPLQKLLPLIIHKSKEGNVLYRNASVYLSQTEQKKGQRRKSLQAARKSQPKAENPA